MNKQITRVWSFSSDSNPNLEHETLQYGDGITSSQTATTSPRAVEVRTPFTVFPNARLQVWVW